MKISRKNIYIFVKNTSFSFDIQIITLSFSFSTLIFARDQSGMQLTLQYLARYSGIDANDRD